MLDTNKKAVQEFLNINGLPHDGGHLVPDYSMLLLSTVDPDIQSGERRLYKRLFEVALESILLRPEPVKELADHVQDTACVIHGRLDDDYPTLAGLSVEDLCWTILRYRLLIVRHFRIPKCAYDTDTMRAI